MDLPKGIEALGPEAQERVRELVEAARRRQQEEIRSALAESMRLVPRPLRGTVRKVAGL